MNKKKPLQMNYIIVRNTKPNIGLAIFLTEKSVQNY